MAQTEVLPNDKLAQSYNDIPYPSASFPHCNPIRLHALAKMKGLNPAPLEKAKVLEIGCSFGGNLLAFAQQFPDSLSIGIDLAEAQVQAGQEMLDFIGISNIQLVAADISKVRFETQFDYIICHGVFSWVPDFVQSAILSTIQHYLSPNGVAFVSYNAYPGWKHKEIAKDLMLFGSNPNLPRLEQTYQALEMLKFTQDLFKPRDMPFYSHMNQCIEQIVHSSQSYIAHEYLEDYNKPMYFKQFTQLAAEFGLAYITDTNVPCLFNNHIGTEKMVNICSYFNDRLDDITQYFDFLENTAFRCDMLTHQTNMDDHQLTNNLSQFNSCQNFDELYLRIATTPYLIVENDVEYWQLPKELKVKRSAVNDLLFNYLKNHSGNCQIKQIYADLKQDPAFDQTQMQHLLWSIVHSNYTHISFYPVHTKAPGKKPKIADVRRKLLQFLRQNPNITLYTDIFGQVVNIREVTAYFSYYLDGTRTIKGLIKAYKQELKQNGLIMKTPEGINIPFEEIKDKEIEAEVNSLLAELAYHGYFE